MSNIIQITNIAATVTEDNIRTLFTFIGPIREIIIYFENSQQEETKVAYIVFESNSDAETSLHLHNTVFHDRALIVLPLAESCKAQIPDVSYAKLVRAPEKTVTGITAKTKGWPSDVVSMVVGRTGEQSIVTIEPSFVKQGLPNYPKLPYSTEVSKVDEIRRTVLITNLGSGVTAQQVLDFFQPIAEVKFIRMAGSEKDNAAYVEFSEQGSVSKAFGMMGTDLNGRAVMIQHSNVAISKPPSISSGSNNHEGGGGGVSRRVRKSTSRSHSRRRRRRSSSRRRSRSRSSSRRRKKVSKRRSRSPRRESKPRRRSRSQEKSRRSPRRHHRKRSETPVIKDSSSKRRRERSVSRERKRKERSVSRERKRRERSVSRERRRKERSRSPRRNHGRIKEEESTRERRTVKKEKERERSRGDKSSRKRREERGGSRRKRDRKETDDSEERVKAKVKIERKETDDSEERVKVKSEKRERKETEEREDRVNVKSEKRAGSAAVQNVTNGRIHEKSSSVEPQMNNKETDAHSEDGGSSSDSVHRAKSKSMSIETDV